MYAIGKVLIDVIVVLFFVGMAGSAIVVIISFFEDFKELLGDDDALPEPPPHAPAKTAEAKAGLAYQASKPHIQL
ncbi:hypothetical protein [Occallatibacter savannae]|uniref:hypothetical protein n=1 Tax=Occallatibacter savannae TaxID=1002691 RepID=UPI000D68C46E|nr:hypothetical protein [Occallatibacter savannae]